MALCSEGVGGQEEGYGWMERKIEKALQSAHKDKSGPQVIPTMQLGHHCGQEYNSRPVAPISALHGCHYHFNIYIVLKPALRK